MTMNNEPLTIIVGGRAMSGKTRLLYLLKNFLRESGFEVELQASNDYPTEEAFDKYAEKNFDEVITSMKENKKIVLKEHQLNKNFLTQPDGV